jgi:hypothetical protein
MRRLRRRIRGEVCLEAEALGWGVVAPWPVPNVSSIPNLFRGPVVCGRGRGVLDWRVMRSYGRRAASYYGSVRIGATQRNAIRNR